MVDAEISCGGFRPQWIEGRVGAMGIFFPAFLISEMCNLQQQQRLFGQAKADRVICVYGHAYKLPATTTVADYSFFTTGERANKS